MRFTLRTLFGFLLLVAVVTAVVVSQCAPVRLTLGMDQGRVESLLRRINAKDISNGMSQYTGHTSYPEPTVDYPDSKYNPTGMWHLFEINLTVETAFVGGKLTEINVWDWTGRMCETYHRTQQYDSVSELIIPLAGSAYQCKVLETRNPGVNPPRR